MPRREKHYSNPARKGAVAGGLSWAAERNGGTVSFLAMSKVQRAFLRSLVLIVLGCVLLAPAQAQFGPQGTSPNYKLVGTGASGAAQQGWAVALSDDGNSMIVGGPLDNGGKGAAWIFTRSSGTWSQTAELKPANYAESGNGEFGYSVGISPNGSTAIVGAPYDNSNQGAAWIFTANSGWHDTAKLSDSGSATAQQGWSVAISDSTTNVNGTVTHTAVVGGPSDGSQAGAVWLYTLIGSTWAKQFKTSGSGASGPVAAMQGYSVAVSSDGNTIIEGGPGDNSNAGAAWIFARSCIGVLTCTWALNQVGNKVVGTGATGTTSAQGTSVAISGDGGTAIIGGPGDDSNAGAAWIFTISGFSWSQQAGPVVSGSATGAAKQGSGVGLSDDGNRAIVGGYADNSNVGAAWIYVRSGSTWSQSGNKLTASDATGASKQGLSAAMSGDGDTAVVGGPTDNSNVGAAWAYIPVPDMTIALAHNGTFHRGDSNDTYTITVTNSGLAATNATVTVTVPVSPTSGLTPTPAGMSGSGWLGCAVTTPPPPPLPPPATTGVPTASCYTNNVLNPGHSYPPLTLHVSVASSAPAAVTLQAQVAGGGETITGNDAAADLVQLPPVPDLTIAMSHSGTLYRGRTGVPYSIQVSNISINASTSGPATVTIGSPGFPGVLPSGLTSLAFGTVGAWSCNSGTLTCTNTGTLGPSSAYPDFINLTVNVTNPAPASVTLTATVTGGGDVTPANDSASDTALVATSGPGLNISLKHNGTFSKAAGVGTYVIMVSNSGGGPTGGTITVTNTPPGALTPTAVSGGRGWKCTLGSTVSCSRNDPLLAGLSYYPITVTVSISGSLTVPTSVPNSASVSGGSTTGSTATDSIIITQ